MKKHLLSKLFMFFVAPLVLGACGEPPVEEQKPSEETETEVTTEKYSFVFNGTHCKADNLGEYEEGTQISVKITPDENYKFNDGIVVEGVDFYQFSEETGILSLTMTNNVAVSCVCISGNLREIFFNLEHMTAQVFSTVYKDAPVQVLFVADDGYELPEKEDYELINAQFVIYDKEIGEAIMMVSDTATVTGSAVRSVCDFSTEILNASVQGLKDSYYVNEVCTGKLVANKQYVLPEHIVVEGDSNINSYNPATGEFEILVGKKCKIRAAAIYSPVAVTYTPAISNGSISKTKNYSIYDEFREIITPDNNHLLPAVTEIEVIGLEEGYSYDSKTGVIFGTVIGNIQISANCPVDQSKVATYSFNGTHCNSSSVGTLFIGDAFKITITPENDFALPVEIAEISGLAEGYTYSKSTGEVSGFVSANEVVITCVAEEILDPVSFTFTGTNCTSNALSQYSEKDEIEITITAEFGYELPSTYTSTGLTVTSYNPATGVLKATINSDATLEIVATKITTKYWYSVEAENCELNFSGEATFGDTVEVTVVPKFTYTLPVDIASSSGCKDLTYDQNTGVISFVIIGETEIKLTAEYNPKQFTFKLTGTNVSSDADLLLTEGADFSCTLIPDELYALPEEVAISGLENPSYDSTTGEVGGIVIGNVSITCNCAFDSEHYASLVLHCTNCSCIQDIEYVRKDFPLYLDFQLDNGYYLDESSIEVVSGVFDYEVGFSSFEATLDGISDVVEINITALAEEDPIQITALNCNISIYGGRAINKLGFAKIQVDEGYYLPTSITYDGIDVITYSNELQILTFRRLESKASISITAVPGSLTYDSTITNKEMENLLYTDYDDGVWDFSHHGFLNVTSTTVRTFSDRWDEKVDSTNDVIVSKSDYNKSSVTTKNTIKYCEVNNIYEDPFDGYCYYYENQKGWKRDDDAYTFQSLDIAEKYTYGFNIDEATYVKNGRYYYGSFDYIPTSLYFKNGKFAAILVQYLDDFTYVQFDDYGTTEVEEYKLPTTFYSIEINTSFGCDEYNSTDMYEYEEGYKLSVLFETYYDYVFDESFSASGFINASFDSKTGLFTGILIGNASISISAHDPNPGE